MVAAPKEVSTLTVRIEPALLTRFKVVAAKKQRPMSEIVREFIEWYSTKEEHERV